MNRSANQSANGSVREMLSVFLFRAKKEGGNLRTMPWREHVLAAARAARLRCVERMEGGGTRPVALLLSLIHI